MELADLNQKLAAYGADMWGVNDRFLGDAQFYGRCLADILAEPSLERLAQALGESDFGAAFDAAHGLKGLSGNLGLTPFYTAICALVESLRAKEYGRAQGELQAVLAERQRLRQIFEPSPP